MLVCSGFTCPRLLQPTPPTCTGASVLFPRTWAVGLRGLGAEVAEDVTWGDSVSQGLEKAVHFLPVLEEACSRAFSTVGESGCAEASLRPHYFLVLGAVCGGVRTPRGRSG